jgi:hypothetical protein
MNDYGSLHFYIQKTNLPDTEKNNLTFICQKLEARKCFTLVGNEVFSKLFHLMCHLFTSDKKITKIQHQIFFVSHPVYHYHLAVLLV